MRRLSSPLEKLGGHWPVVVVGSGYGGAIAASRLARAGQKVCVLERGKERLPGEYPRTSAQFLRETQLMGPGGGLLGKLKVGSPTGLLSLHLLGDLAVVTGSGLGGTSLINAGVALRPDPRVLEDACWPSGFRADLSGMLEDGFSHVERMLGVQPYPESHPKLRKLEALERSAEFTGGRFYRPPLAVTFKEHVNPAGVRQRACTLCGDCATGCNVGAKNSLQMNYLPDAQHHGAELFTQVAVHHLERGQGCWRVYYRLIGVGRELFDAPLQFLTADHVILAAGTLGSTEILLRSRAAGLPLSGELGKRFSGNGDVMAFGYNLDVPVNAVGQGDHPENTPEPVGPTITGIIDMRDTPWLDEGLVIEEGGVPAALGGYLPALLAAVSPLMGEDTDEGFIDGVQENARVAESLVRGPYHGAVHNTQTLFAMTHDDGGGELRLEGDGLRAVWPGAGRQENFLRADVKLRKAVEALGGTYVRNPVGARLLDNALLITHPLGGCVMAEDAEQGVVDHEGRVFSGETGRAVHEGLYVCDGAVIPRALGINPLLTISAVSERFAARMARRHGWRIDYAPVPEHPLPPRQPMGLRFTESLKGFISTAVDEGFVQAANPDRPGASELRFIITVLVEDLDKLLKDPRHPMGVTGCVLAPALSARPLSVTHGTLNVLVEDPEKPGYKQLRYALHLLSESGERFLLEGFKRLTDDPGIDFWEDTTTLFITLRRGEGPAAPLAYKGMLRISVDDFARQCSTFRVTNAPGVQEQLAAVGRFGEFFLGGLFELYWKPSPDLEP
jgi:cholesterol oxidase